MRDSDFIRPATLLAAVTWLNLGFALPAEAADIVFQRHIINAETDYSAAAVIDVNRDGKPDIVCGGDWYEAPDWNRHFVRNVPRIRGRPDGFAHLTLDVNRDGWTDLITVNYRSGSIKWIQHPGATIGPWTTHVVVEPGPMETGRLLDIDGDGQVDLLPNGARFAAWFELVRDEADPAGVPRWVRHELPAEAGGHGLGFGDIDGDGRGDIVGQFGWLQAPSQPRTERWRWHPEYRLERASIPMIVADVDDDGDSDIVWTSAHGFGCYWLEQTQEQQSRNWVRHAIDTSWSQAHAPLWIDLDGDGRNEFVAGKRYMSHGGADPGAFDPLCFYRYQFDPRSRTWNRSPISVGERVGAGLDPKAADMDGDGDLDLVVSGRSGLYLLENQRHEAPQPTPSAVPNYADHTDLLVVHDRLGGRKMVENAADWGVRRSHVMASIEATLGRLPGPEIRVPLDIQVESQVVNESTTERSVRYRVDAARFARAKLIFPNEARVGETPAILCHFDAKNEAHSHTIAHDLATRGYLCLVPEAKDPSDVVADIWGAIRAIDVLQSLPEVHGERLGFFGNDRLALLLAAIDQRLVVTVARAAEIGWLDTKYRGQFSATEVIACIAPRSVWIQAATEAEQQRLHDSASRAGSIFDIRKFPGNLHVEPIHTTSGESNIDDWLDFRLKRVRRPGRQRRSN